MDFCDQVDALDIEFGTWKAHGNLLSRFLVTKEGLEIYKKMNQVKIKL